MRLFYWIYKNFIPHGSHRDRIRDLPPPPGSPYTWIEKSRLAILETQNRRLSSWFEHGQCDECKARYFDKLRDDQRYDYDKKVSDE